MADPTTATPTGSEPVLATPVVEERGRRFSFVWLMPILALLVAGGVVWNNYTSRGPLITIAFDSASGIRAGATEVRIRDLRVGLVESVGFSQGMGAVEAHVRMDKAVAEYVDGEASFWLVQPQVTARGVTGIDTLLSGVYIAASWDGEPGVPTDSFVALPIAPLAAANEEGTRIVLRTRAGGQLAAGAPVLTAGIEVGRIGQPVLSASGTTVTMEAFILKPYDARLTTSARFWDASGLSVNVGAEGLAVKVNSLAALLEGGVTFGTPVSGGEPVLDGHVYDVFPTEATARADAFEADTSTEIVASVLLDADVNGLGNGTVVRFRGVKVGEVEDVVGIAPEEGSDGPVKLRIDMRISPTRLGFPATLSPQQIREALEVRVTNGLSARVSAEGLFGQTVIMELVNLRSAETAELTYGPEGRMLLPTAKSAQPSADSGVEGLVNRVANLPIEDLMGAATQALTGVTGLTNAAQDLIASESVTSIPQNVDATLAEVRALVEGIRTGGAVDNFNATLASANATLKSVEGAAQTLPQTVEQTLEQVNALVSDLRTGGAVDNLNSTMASASETLKSVQGAAEQLPKTVDETLAEIRGLVTDIRTGGTLENVNAALASVSGTLKSVEGAAQTLPATIDKTLVEVSALIAELRDGGAVENLNATLKSADSALRSVDGAARSLPELAARLNGVADGLNAVVAGYNTNSRFYNEVRGTLREVSATAESFRSLARSIERNPSSLIRGR
ncbi:MlaD family protein [Rhizobiaceae bacterium]|nr:MlaD family protein [Rhizobiaceae bacterium]